MPSALPSGLLAFTVSCTAWYCSCVPPANLSLIPTAIVCPLLGGFGRAYPRHRGRAPRPNAEPVTAAQGLLRGPAERRRRRHARPGRGPGAPAAAARLLLSPGGSERVACRSACRPEQ